MADSAHWVVSQPVETSGNFFIDENVVQQMGITDLDAYAVDPTVELMPDFFV